MPSLSTDKSERTARWTNVRTPATVVGRALEMDLGGSEFDRLDEGIAITKVTSQGKFKPRVATMSRDRYALFITHQKVVGGKDKGLMSYMARKLPLPMFSRKGILGWSNSEDMRDHFVRHIDVADIDYISHGCVETFSLESTRTGNRLLGENSRVDEQRHTIVVIGHHGNQTLEFLVPNDDERKLLIKCLTLMRYTYQSVKVAVSNEALLLRYIWYDIDADQNGLISESEFLKIMSRINFEIKAPAKAYQEYLKEVDSPQGLRYTQVMSLLQRLKNQTKRSIENRIWDEAFGENVEWVTAGVFHKNFILAKQGETYATEDDVNRLFTFINMVELNVEDELIFEDPQNKINRTRFELYLHHKLNNAYDPWSLEVDNGIRLVSPISQYWISTSHNTYLTGDQLQSSSSVEMYMNALRRGCKCLELDCWDGEQTEDGKYLPVVFHGHTLTSKILFADILRGVATYIEQNPDTYPIILSLENHCSHPFQKQMAADLIMILGRLLFVPREADRDIDLPSPENLRGRCVIKGKRPPESDDAPLIDDTEEYDPYEQGTLETPDSSERDKAKQPKIVSELAQLTLFHGTKFKEFSRSIQEPPMHMHSISEPKITKIVNKKSSNSKLWREYNISHMTRTYPAGTRVDSSNYNPVLAWGLGCQLVALNFQTNDPPLLLNDGLFAQNGGCGYILKPQTVMLELTNPEDEMNRRFANEMGRKSEIVDSSPAPTKEETLDPISEIMDSFSEVMCGATGPETEVVPSVVRGYGGVTVSQRLQEFKNVRQNQSLPQRISIRILSGKCLPKPKGAKKGETIDPYVFVTVHDIKEMMDGSLGYVTASHSTNPVTDNGFCPEWNERKAKDFIIHSPQVAMVHFSLVESDIGLDDKVGDVAIPVCCLRKGYRSIQLMDRNAKRTGPFGFATLLVHIDRNDIIN